MRVKQRTFSPMIMGLVLGAFLLLTGFNGEGLASNPEVPLQVEGDRLTGNLAQVTLGAVLEELHQQLGVDYEVPAGELEKVISVDLQQVPILPALARILAPWDYAFTVNAAGHLRSLYITPKAPPAEGRSEASESRQTMPTQPVTKTGVNSLNRSESEQGGGGIDPSMLHERDLDPFRSPSTSPYESFPEEPGRSNTPVAVIPMPVQPVPDGTMMPIAPASGGAGMEVTPQTNAPDMPIIPSSAFPPMDVQPVPDYLQEEMLRNMQP